jgi:uncharacterized protein (DUF2461 family)
MAKHNVSSGVFVNPTVNVRKDKGAVLAAAALLEDCKSHQPSGVRMLVHTNSADSVFLHLGSGLWMPDAQPLALLRRNIDRKPEVIRRVLTDAAFRKTILGVAANDEKKAIKAFASHNAENALKTKPKVRAFSSVKPVLFSVCTFPLYTFRDFG